MERSATLDDNYWRINYNDLPRHESFHETGIYAQAFSGLFVDWNLRNVQLQRTHEVIVTSLKEQVY